MTRHASFAKSKSACGPWHHIDGAFLGKDSSCPPRSASRNWIVPWPVVFYEHATR
jgi:hypothetical protein